MQKIYTSKAAPVADDTNMKTPRMSTISFLRSFARAYTYAPIAGAIICN